MCKNDHGKRIVLISDPVESILNHHLVVSYLPILVTFLAEFLHLIRFELWRVFMQ